MRSAALALLIGLVCAAGCNRGPRLVPFTGQLVIEGRPQGTDTVALVPVAGLGKERTQALVDREGKFSLKTYPHGDGVMPGKYKVLVQLDPGVKALDLYSFADTTPLEVEVPDNGVRDYVIRIPLPTK
jgi:hypothetical protein